MRIFAKLAKEVFNSGKAIGLKTNITDATKYLKAHQKASEKNWEMPYQVRQKKLTIS